MTNSSVREILGPNPPTMALMAVPAAVMDYRTARHVWLIASLASLAVTLFALMRYTSSTRSPLPAVAVAVVLLNPTVFANLRTQTTVGFFRRLCVADPTWNPSPAAECGPIAMVVPAVLLGTALVITVLLAGQAPSRLWLSAAVCLSELTLPVAAEPHFVSLAIPLAFLWTGSTSRVVLAIAALLLLVPLDYTAHRFTSGWSVLLAYPRLYASWLLWGAAVMEMYRLRRDVESPSG